MDNFHCQATMANPFGDTRKREEAEAETQKLMQNLMDIHTGKRSIQEVCGPEQKDWLGLHLPGEDRKQYQLGQAGLLDDSSTAPTPKPTFHENAQNVPIEPTPMPTFGDNDNQGSDQNTIAGDNMDDNQGGNGGGIRTQPPTPQGGNNQNGNSNPKDGEVCGMDMKTNEKLFWYCGVCGGDASMACDSASAVTASVILGGAALTIAAFNN